MSAGRACPKCGTALSDDSLGGLCRKCLGRVGFLFESAENSLEAPAAIARGRFGDYELLEEVARGGMGVVYRARQVSLNRIVAVKMLLHGAFSSEEFLQRFRIEAQAAAGLHHPNIVPLYEVGELDGRPYFSMEYIEGKTLAEAVREKPMGAGRAASYLKSVAQAMQYAHERGILHRDLKPSNILLDIFDQPRITDFGLAKLLDDDTQLTLTGQALGSPGHMPPEQVAGGRASSIRGDVYSLGAILYHLITGRPPFQGETVHEVLLQAQTSVPVNPRRLNPSVPEALQTICLKCLQKTPAQRYASAAALAEDLGRFLAHEPILARPVTLPQQVWLWCRRHPGPAGLSGALLLAVSLGLAGILGEWRRAERHARGESTHRQRAEVYANQIGLNLYAADISLASHAYQQGDYGLARRTLSGMRPKHAEPDLRGFEWRLLWELCRGDQSLTLTGHEWIVTCASFSPEGRLLATGSQDGTAKVWDLTRRQLLTTLLGEPGAVWSTAFSPEGTMLMTATTHGVFLWSTNDWLRIRSFPGRLAALSRTGDLLATADASPFSWEPAGKVVLWNYRTGDKVKELSQSGRAMAFSPDGRMLAVAGASTNVDLLEVPSGKRLRILPTDKPVWSVTFSPGGRQLVAAGWSDTPLVWSLEQEGPPRLLKGHLRTVWSSAFSPDGSTLITASSDQSVRLWDAVTLRPKGLLHGHESEVWCVAASPDGTSLATGSKDQTVRLWPSNAPGRQDCLPNQLYNRPFFSPDGRHLQVVGKSGGEWRCQLWDVPSRTLVADLPDGWVVGFSPDGDQLFYLNVETGALDSWGLKARTMISHPLAGSKRGKLAFVRAGTSPDGRTLFALDSDGQIRFWQSADGKLVGSARGPGPPIRAAVLGPGGRYLALSLERENIVRLFATSNGQERRLAGHRDFVSGLAFSPDGVTLATGGMDGTIRLWEVATGRALAILPGHMEEVTDLAFSPDGRTLGSVGQRDAVKLWHVATGRELVSLDFPGASLCLRFAPDGKRLAVTTEDNTVRLFEAPLEVEAAP